ncbi:hypothetical protein [Phaeovulum sp. W22_SRMD_FR3]|jgi:hypothetical protein|uniref:hypothetical protein n=1 Tax=Phaeovulum sp. W22_SRMD_FR3 TaxID=3240274 RepID=UPI003F975193
MVKIITLFLIVIAALAVFGRFRISGFGKKKPKKLTARCLACGRPRIGTSPCPCGGAGNKGA